MATPFQLTKEQVAERARVCADMRTAHDELTAAVNAYNERLSALREFCQAIADDARAAFDEKSERWQEGDAGSEVNDWIGEWEGIEIPDDVDEPDESCIDAAESIDDRRPMRKPRAARAKANGATVENVPTRVAETPDPDPKLATDGGAS